MCPPWVTGALETRITTSTNNNSKCIDNCIKTWQQYKVPKQQIAVALQHILKTRMQQNMEYEVSPFCQDHAPQPENLIRHVSYQQDIILLQNGRCTISIVLLVTVSYSGTTNKETCNERCFMCPLQLNDKTQT